MRRLLALSLCFWLLWLGDLRFARPALAGVFDNGGQSAATSLYGKNASAGDTPVAVDSAGAIKVSQLPATSIPGDSFTASSMSQIQTFPGAFNGSNWDRLRTGSAANLTATTQQFGLLVTRAGDWAVQNSPGAANVQATVSKPAGSIGVRHVCTAILASITASASAPAATNVLLVLRDGPTASGTTIWQTYLGMQAVAGYGSTLALSGLNFVGSPATQMTLEFTGAGGVNTYEIVNMMGYDIQ